MTKLCTYVIACTLQAAVQVHIVVHLPLFAAVLIIMMISGERSA